MKKEEFRNYGAWALVTGAASGMGRLYAFRLAERGYNLMLVDIDGENLGRTAQEARKHAAGKPHAGDFSIRTIVQDLAREDAAVKVAEAARGLEVEVLVNNAGVMYCRKLEDTSRKALSLMMMLHMYTPLMLCREFVPRMKGRGCGYVLNISSLAAWMEWPAIGMYGNTKRFVKGFSRQLRVECMGSGVSVTNAYFGAVDTPLIPLVPKYRKLALSLGVMIPAEKAVSKALDATFKRRKGTMPGLVNKIALPVVMILPDAFLAWLLKTLGPVLMTGGK